jgi:competence protein ComEA
MFKKFLAALLAFVAAAAFAAVDVNKADAAALDGIKGIGPGIAGKILDERKKGSFKDWDDLITRVQGIGEGSAAKLSEAGLTVNGKTFKGVAAAPAKKDEKKADAKADAKKDAKAEAKPAAKADAKADTKPAAKAEAKPEVKAEKAPKADAKTEKKADAKADAKAEKKADAKAEKKDEKK